jgi:hypothetical protein
MTGSFHDGGGSTTEVLVNRLAEAAPDRAEVIDSYVASPLYGFIAEHQGAVLAVGALGLWHLLWGRRSEGRWMTAYRAKAPVERLLVWLLAITSIIHASLLLAHEPSGFTIAYALGAALPAWVVYRFLSGLRWRRYAALTLVGLVGGYFFSTIGGEPPDQAGIATKLVELTALAIVLQPRRLSARRRIGAATAVVSVFVLTSLGAWVGAFATGEGGHHLGETPTPGVLLPAGEDHPPTAAERRAADDLYTATAAAIALYRDPAVAAADGYQVDGLRGTGFHADNPAYKHDGRILDPARPETLVYAVAESGEAVLLGAMFQMDEIGQAGPAVGGPLTVWHAHDHICLTVPFAITGVTSPYGLCPLGAFTLPITNEMLHVWVLDGVEDRFGDIDEEWLDTYLAGR